MKNDVIDVSGEEEILHYDKWETLPNSDIQVHLDTQSNEAYIQASEMVILTFEQVARLYGMCYPTKQHGSCKL